MANWDVSLFAYLKERHGPKVTVTADGNAGSILDALTASGVDTKACRLAVNERFVKREEIVRTGSTVALIPPVSGG